MVMKNTYSTLRVVFLWILLFHAPQTLQREGKRNVDGNVGEVMAKNGKGSFNFRDLLSAASQGDYFVRMEITFDEEDRPWNEDKTLVTTTSESASNEGSELDILTKPPSIYFGPPSECSPKCVKGDEFYQERFAVCRDHLGIPVHMSECAPRKKSWNGSFVACPKLDCDESRTVKMTAWKPCPKTCTIVLKKGTVVPDTVKRRWKCKKTNPYSSSVATNGCMSLIKKLGLMLERECPLKPCTEYRMEPSSWGNCDCETWTRERTSRCKDNEHPKSKVPVETCQNFGLELVDETQRCLPQKKCDTKKHLENKHSLSKDTFDFCNYSSCSTHGTCKHNDCHCEKGFFGHDCQWDKRETDECPPPSILLGGGTCCKSGIYNYAGYCCPGKNTDLQLDKNGNCCLGELDMCGNCNPEEPEFRDVRGTCCKVLDAGGFCCPSGKVDECGVCDGLSLTCKAFVRLSVHEGTKVPDIDECTSALRVHIARNMRVHSSAIQQKTVEDGRKFRFAAQRVILSLGLLAHKVRSVTKIQAVKYKCGRLVNTTVYRSPICGNSFCEIGEASPESRFHCPEDCTYEIARCPLSKDRLGRLVVCTGHGSCSFREKAICECFEGYTGINCEKCQYGFFSLGKDDSRCLPRQAYINGPTYTPPVPVPEQPIEAPLSVEVPYATPFSSEEPVESPISEEAVEAPILVLSPVESPISEEAVEAPILVLSPVESPISEEAVEAPVSEEGLIESPISVLSPVESPISEEAVEAPVSEEGLIESPISVLSPVESPISEVPVESPLFEPSMPEEAPFEVPASEEKSSEAPFSTEEPKSETPIPSPERELEEEAKPFSMHFGPFSECYPSCVRGVDFYKERSALCRDYLGIPVHMSKCTPTKDSFWRSYMMCPQFDCEEDVLVELLGWEHCPRTCTEVTKDGTIAPDHVARHWKCKANTKSTTNEAKSCQPLVEKLGLKMTRECPLKPCRDYRVEPSNWKRCDCSDWTQKRKILCNHDHEPRAKDQLKTCLNFGLELINTSRRCLPKYVCDSIATIRSANKLSSHPFDYCGYSSCSTHGTCKENECQCEKGFSGDDCQWDQREGESKCVPPSILLGDGACCESGIYNYTGHCCPGNNTNLQLDKNGDCCSGKLDICGNCNPKEREFRDMRGTCCKVLDAGGFCCPSDKVDECGVCNGLGLTCNTIVSMSFQKETVLNEAEKCASALLPKLARAMWVKESAIETETVDGGSFTFTATGVIVTSGLLTKKVSNVAKGYSVRTPCGRFANLTVSRSAKCGNSFCEIGEASPESDSHCPEDCTYEIARCPSSKDKLGRLVVCNGHGSCSFRDTATCDCFEGYIGDSCDQCQFGFSHIGTEDDFRCLPRQAYINGPSPSVQERIVAVQ